MANPLTGGYEAVVQIAVRQIDALLGTIHQNAATPDPVLKLLHSTAMRIGDPRRKFPDVGVFGDWLTEYQRAGPGRGLGEIRTQLIASTPPGAAQMLTDAFAKFDQNWEVELPPDVVRGLAKFQVSSVNISVPSGSSSEVTVHARIRAHYYPDPGTTILPAPVHGDLQIAFDVRKVRFHSGMRLVIQPSSQDSKIQFTAASGTGLDAVEQSRIAGEIRKVVREDLTQIPVDLPPDFPFADFKGLGSGANQVVALPFQLSGAPPAGGPQSLTQSFIGSSGFAFAVSKDYVSGLIDIAAIREAIKSRSVVLTLSRWGASISVTYKLRFSSGPTLIFKSGGFEISGRIEAETNTWWAPNGFVSFRQMIALTLEPSSQTVRPERIGEPDVDQSWFMPHGTAVDVVKSEIDKALSANKIRVERIFSNARSSLARGLRTFDPFAAVSYAVVEVTPDGVIVRGEIGSAARRAPVVNIAETHQGAAFTAFQSWIPAGRIDRFIWSWVEHSGPTAASIWSGTQKNFTDEHHFIMPKPAGIWDISQICLRIEGTQITPSGHEISIVAGTTCQLPDPGFAIDLPSWWEPLTLPTWRPDLHDTTTLRGAIAGHVGVQSDLPETEQSSRNTLVYFADWRSEKPLANLNAALSRAQISSAPLVVVVVPAGAFESSRREFEGRLPPIGERASAPMQFTEDDEGGWTRTFGVVKTPSAYLVNARREFVWKHEGEPDPSALAAVLDQHAVAARAPQFRPLRLTVAPGDSAPDATFEDDLGDQFALHRFRGRNMLLNFWQSWSAPCLAELSRLQRLHQASTEKPFIVAFHGGKDSKRLDEIRKRLGLSFPLVQDSQQRLARRYGVRCWPTTILVDADGRVQHIQTGIEHEHEPSSGREQSKTAETPA
jgi:peroxiredoxin